MRPQRASISPDAQLSLNSGAGQAMKSRYNIVRVLGLAYLVSVPLETLPFPLVRSPSTLLGAIWLLAWMAELAVARRPPKLDMKFWWLLVAATVWALATTAWSYNTAESQQFAFSLLALGLSAMAVSDVFCRDHTAPAIALACGAAIGSLAILLVGPDETRQNRASFEGIDENIMSFHLCLGVALCLYLLFKLKNPIARASAFGGVILIGSASLMTGSRTGATALAATLLLAALVLARSPIRVFFSLGLIGVIYFLGQSLLSSGLAPARIAEFAAGEDIVDTRPIILEGFLTTQENWWLKGIGAGSDADYLAATGGWYSNVHNAFWQLFIEQGLVGLLIWVGLFLLCAERATHAPMRLAILLSAPTIAGFMWTLGPLESNMLWALVGLALAGRVAQATKHSGVDPTGIGTRSRYSPAKS